MFQTKFSVVFAAALVLAFAAVSVYAMAGGMIVQNEAPSMEFTAVARIMGPEGEVIGSSTIVSFADGSKYEKGSDGDFAILHLPSKLSIEFSAVAKMYVEVPMSRRNVARNGRKPDSCELAFAASVTPVCTPAGTKFGLPVTKVEYPRVSGGGELTYYAVHDLNWFVIQKVDGETGRVVMEIEDLDCTTPVSRQLLTVPAGFAKAGNLLELEEAVAKAKG